MQYRVYDPEGREYLVDLSYEEATALSQTRGFTLVPYACEVCGDPDVIEVDGRFYCGYHAPDGEGK
jgi:hypothetical protein